MFLISKIVRGRRLLQELEADAIRREAEEAAAAAAAAAKMAARLPRRGTQQGRGSKMFASGAPGTSSSSQHKDSRCSIGQSPLVPGTSSNRRRSTMERRWKQPQSLREPHRSSSVLECRRKTEHTKKSSSSLSNEGRAIRQKTDSSLPDDGLTHDYSENAVSPRMRRTSSMPSICDLAAKQDVRHYDYDTKLNRLQKRSLRFTWHRLQTKNGGKRVDNVFEEVYDRMVKQQPVIRDMFTTRTFLSAMSRSDIATLRDHARVTVKMINHVIKNLDQEAKKRNDTGSELDPRLIGRAHGNLRPYGFTGNYWEKLGETIIDVVLAQEAVRDLPGAGQAWVVLTACLVDQLRAGFDESKSHSSMSMVTQKVLYNAAAQLDDMISPETSAECCSGMYVTAPSSYSPGNFPAQPLPLQFVSDATPVCSYLCGVRGKSHTEERKSRIDTCDTCNEPRIQHRDSRDMHSDSRAISVEPVESRGELRETRAEDACEFHRMRRQSVRDARRRSRHEANQATAEAQASIAANINSSNGTNGFLPATTSTFDS